MLEISVLGPLYVKCESGRHAVPGTKLRSIIAVLAMSRGDLIHRDELIEELGLEQFTPKNVNAIHAHIARLRKWLQKTCGCSEVLVTEGNGYRFDFPPDRVDALRFTELVESAWTIEADRPDERVRILKDALDLWRGTAFGDVNDGPHVRSQADYLQQLRFEAQEAMVAALSALNDRRRVILYASRFISEDPLRERLWEHLLDALYREGRYAEVHESYHRVARLLARELGIEPNPALRAQLHRIPGTRPSNGGDERAKSARLADAAWLGPRQTHEVRVLPARRPV